MKFEVYDDTGPPRIASATLARFGGRGLSWPEIMQLGRSVSWWRSALMAAEDAGILYWDGSAKRWRRTLDGDSLVRGIS